jgi:hypothetical protein
LTLQALALSLAALVVGPNALQLVLAAFVFVLDAVSFSALLHSLPANSLELVLVIVGLYFGPAELASQPLQLSLVRFAGVWGFLLAPEHCDQAVSVLDRLAEEILGIAAFHHLDFGKQDREIVAELDCLASKQVVLGS